MMVFFDGQSDCNEIEYNHGNCDESEYNHDDCDESEYIYFLVANDDGLSSTGSICDEAILKYDKQKGSGGYVTSDVWTS